MKHINRAAIAALSAFAVMACSVGSASATTLEDATGAHPTVIDFSLVGSSVLSSGGTTLDTCTGGTMEGIPTTGGATTTVKEPIASANTTWSGCTKTAHTIEGGELEIHHIAGTSNGTVTGAGFKWTRLTFGVSCVYGLSEGTMVHFGTLTGSSATPVLHIDTEIIKREGGFLCPNTAKWKANYHVTTPSGLTVTAG